MYNISIHGCVKTLHACSFALSLTFFVLYRKWIQCSRHANSSPSEISLGLQQLLGKEVHSIWQFVRAKYCVKCLHCKLHFLLLFLPTIVSVWSAPPQLRTSFVFPCHWSGCIKWLLLLYVS